MSTFSDRLRELRVRERLSQDGLGEKLGVSQQTVQRWEAGRTKPNDDQIRLIAERFRVTTDYLLGLVDVPNIYRHPVSLPDGREGVLLDMVEASPSQIELTGFMEFLRANPGLPPSQFPDDYKPLVQFVKSVLLELLQKPV